MSFIFYIFLFILGTIIGSFINALNYRLYHNKKIHKGRSACPSCQHVLSWLDLFPIISFCLLRGRCRYCRERIPLNYLLVEISAGLLIPLIWFFSNTFIGAFFYSFFFLIFLAIAWFDLEHYLIPDKLLMLSMIMTFVFLIWQDTAISNWSESLLLSGFFSGIVAFLFFFLIYTLTRGRGMGFGDVKLSFVMGLVLGWPNIIVAVFLSFFIGAIIGLAMVASQKRKIKDAVPFGPFLVLGTLIAALWGTEIISWYFSFIK
jgi:leader peptidase (prepilin peptidase) / N-methyltransferase